MPFLHVPASKDIREEAERRQLDLLRGNVDLVVLARYMQILSPEFCEFLKGRAINIHHSFLP
ncbi:MAG: formyltetrahydrofolate deformylase, partial [Mycolicibacterium sp.]|nr:formyltetrahydrofolate deformylase [Mycolicibacterium sp.]